MKRLAIAALIAAAFTSAAPADAHRVSAAAAQNAWYARFNHECGNGFWWICTYRGWLRHTTTVTLLLRGCVG